MKILSQVSLFTLTFIACNAAQTNVQPHHAAAAATKAGTNKPATSQNGATQSIVQSFTVSQGKDSLKTLTSLITKEKNVVIKFYNNHCPYCSITVEGFEKVARQYQDCAVFLTLNTDIYGSIASHYKIRTVPHFLVFVNGKLTSKFSRLGSKEEGFVAAIENILKNVSTRTNS